MSKSMFFEVFTKWALATSVVLVVFMVLGAVTGCATGSGKTLKFKLADHPTKGSPACRYKLLIDGEVLHEGVVDHCPQQPVQYPLATCE